jgi:putative oxidoreductase
MLTQPETDQSPPIPVRHEDLSLRYALIEALLVRDLGLLLIRVVAGVTLAAHGYPKLFGGPGKRPPKLLASMMGPNYPAAVERSGPGFAIALGKMGVPNPGAAATASGLAELGGGFALAAGFLTRPAAVVLAFNMAVATYKAHWKNGFYGQGGFEFSLLLGTVALSLGLMGPGRISIDHLISSGDA